MSNDPSIVNADDQRLVTYILSAKNRIVFVAPGVSESVSQVLVEKWTELGPDAVRVILDVDPEVSRLGYGTLDGLKIIRDCAERLRTTIFHHPGIRIGLLIADETTLVYRVP